MLLSAGEGGMGARTILLQLTAVNGSNGDPAGVLASASFTVDLPAYGSPAYITFALDPGQWRLDPSTPYALLVENPYTQRSQQVYWGWTEPLQRGYLPDAFQGFTVTGTKFDSDGTTWVPWGEYGSILMEATTAPRCAPTVEGPRLQASRACSCCELPSFLLGCWQRPWCGRAACPPHLHPRPCHPCHHRRHVALHPLHCHLPHHHLHRRHRRHRRSPCLRPLLCRPCLHPLCRRRCRRRPPRPPRHPRHRLPLLLSRC